MSIRDVLKHELIGKTIEITKSENQSLVGIKGEVIDETKNMLTLKTNKGSKKLIKSQITFKTKDQGKTLEIKGEALTKRPEDRIK